MFNNSASHVHFLSYQELIFSYLACDNLLQEKESIYYLEPSVCAYLRDRSCYLKSPFRPFFNIQDIRDEAIVIKNKKIKWVEDLEDVCLKLINLDNYKLKKPCLKRKIFFENELLKMDTLFSDEINFISAFTSAICWLEAHKNEYIGSSAFYEIPHCTFFSDAAMFSIPPTIIVPRVYAGYAIFENLYHEALHHQAHAFSAFLGNHYFKDANADIPEISITWRERGFTLLEGLHALHVYSAVTPLRQRMLEHIHRNENENDGNLSDYSWLIEGIDQGKKMWEELSSFLSNRADFFQAPWRKLINQWSKAYDNFARSSCKT